MKNSGFYTLLFHGLYTEKDRKKQKHPYLFISVDEFKACMKILLDNGLNFLDPTKALCNKADVGQILLTFDDGYYNNRHALKVLEKYNVKAIFFLVRHQIVNQKLFWWDVYFKNKIKKVPFRAIYEEIQELKKLKRHQIERKLIQQFGDDCFEADDELIRPMTQNELMEFSKHPLVEIGVHSSSHEILTNCSSLVIRDEIANCKTFLEGVINKKISAISYPDGKINDGIISIVDELKFKLGVTTCEGFNRCKDFKDRRDWLMLKRNVFPIPKDTRSVIEQMDDFVKQIHS